MEGSEVDSLHALGSIEYTPPSDENTNMARELYEALERHSDRVLIVGTETGREWTGARLLDYCGRLATGLVKQVGLKPNDVVMTICDHNDAEIAMALGVVIAGGALFGTQPADGFTEIETLCNIVQPDVFVVRGKYHERALKLRQCVPKLAQAKIVWLDRPSSASSEQQVAVRTEVDQNRHSGATGGNPLSHAPTSDVGLGHKTCPVDANNNCRQVDTSTATQATDARRRQDERLIIERDQVHLVEELVAGPHDVQLIESIVREQIKTQEHICTYMLTSGSTGRPKVVPSTHSELVHGLYSMISACTNPMPKGLVMTQHELDSNNNFALNNCNGTNNGATSGQNGTSKSLCLMPYGPDETVAGDLPLDHGAGLNTMFLSLWMGSKFVIMPSYDVDAFWQAVSDYKISASMASTTFCYKLFSRLKNLIDTDETDKWDLSSFKYISCCGAKLSFIDLINEVLQHYGHIQVTQAYGCTEIGFISMVHRDDCKTHLHSVGYLFPGLVAKVVDPDAPGKQLGPNERGELLLWARSKFKGYRCLEEDDPARIYADCHDDKGVFYRTGDQAHFDEQRRLYIHGRFKDTLVLMEDWKVLPAELEDVVNEHPLVEMSAVVGMPDPKLPGCHAPRAYVTLLPIDRPELRQLAQTADGKRLVESLKSGNLEHIRESIYDFVASRTSRPKHLTGGVRILDEFPRVGLLNKIDRKALKQMAVEDD